MKLTALLGGFSAALLYQSYKWQKLSTLVDLERDSQTTHLPYGPVEYAVQGEGPTLLICHGGGGGYDQGLLLTFPEIGFRSISLSRPGYLRTPLETGRTFEAQADVCAALLDALHIKCVAVLGASAGGPPALQFALRYPERCWGLILISAVSQPTTAFPPLIQNVAQKVIPHSDFIPWLLLNTPLMEYLIDRNTRTHMNADFEKKVLLKKLMKSMFPASLRLDGTLNDLRQIAVMPNYPLQNISVPTLVIHGDRDSIVPFSQGQYSASAIPNARLLAIKDADHFCFFTHLEIAKPACIDFLMPHAP